MVYQGNRITVSMLEDGIANMHFNAEVLCTVEEGTDTENLKQIQARTFTIFLGEFPFDIEYLEMNKLTSLVDAMIAISKIRNYKSLTS